MSYSTHFVLTAELMFIVVSHSAGSRRQVSGTLSSLDLHQNSFAIPLAVLRLGGIAGISPQDQSFQELQEVLDGVNARVEKPKAQMSWSASATGATQFR